MKKFILIITFIHVFVLINTISAQAVKDVNSNRMNNSKGEDSFLSVDCFTTISNYPDNVNLGDLVVGTVNSDLPGFNGDGNFLIFTVRGDYNKRYMVTSSMELRSEGSKGYMEIIHWDWKTKKNLNWTNHIRDAQLNYVDFELYKKPNDNDCEAFAIFKLFLREIAVSDEAEREEYGFQITITIVEMF